MAKNVYRGAGQAEENYARRCVWEFRNLKTIYDALRADPESLNMHPFSRAVFLREIRTGQDSEKLASLKFSAKYYFGWASLWFAKKEARLP